MVTKSPMITVETLVETEYNQLVSEQLGVNVTLGNGTDTVTVDPNINY